MSDAAAASYDPYAEKPPGFFEKHSEYVWAAAVFVATIVLTVACFPPSRGPELAYVFASPAVFWAYLRPRFKLFALTLGAAQAVAWTVILGWLHHVTWLGLLLLGPFIGLWVGLWYIAVWWAMPRMLGRASPLRIFGLLGLAGLWVVIEWSRTWFLGGFPWAPLAATQWERTSILQIAAYTGASGISFVLIAMNVAFAAYGHRLFREKLRGIKKRSQEFLFAMFLLLACLTVHVRETYRRFDHHLPFGRIALVQPYIPQEIKWDAGKARGIIDVLEQLTLSAASGTVKPDLIVWPEAVTPWAVYGDVQTREWVEGLARRAGTPLLLGSVAFEGSDERAGAWFNGAFLVDPKTGLQPVHYAKTKLVPFGEYVPFRSLLGWLNKFVPIGDGDFVPGQSSTLLTVPMATGPAALAPLICYEDIFPQIGRTATRTGADALLVLTNNGWFGEGGAAYQHAAHSVLRAVENRRPVIRCGNGGWSGWIDEFGTVRKVMTRTNEDDRKTVYFRGTETLSVTRDSRWIGRQSFYAEHGDWFLFVCFGLIGFGWASLAIGKVSPAPPDEEE
jgi:apolipoprotein N-acyltransferase